MRNQYSVWAVKIGYFPTDQHVCCETFDQAMEWARTRLALAVKWNNSDQFPMPDPTIISVSRVHANCERWPDA